MRPNGFEVSRASVESAGQVESRARQLAYLVNQILHRTGPPKVHIIAHSMGGLGARRRIVDEWATPTPYEPCVCVLRENDW
jgi:triacylglycerol esterase/lipase EstA (alpha/beta hydrolase family)